MNLQEASAPLRHLAFRLKRLVAWFLPGGRISAFGDGDAKISSILVINLDRQPRRWRRMLRELGRFRTWRGEPLPNILRRLPAIDARDGRAVAATADVDPLYLMADQLFVQPDTRLEECFGSGHSIRMTPQEVAVARSHIEAWKTIATGSHQHVLVLEDDVYFRRGAARAISRGWRAALRRCTDNGGPHLMYLSFDDANGTATREETCDALFRPLRGLWFLSGYVLSREGAAALLRAMPVVGPVDLWMNYRFTEISALALTRPAIMQREDGQSDNSYSILPFLARAGTVDAGSPPARPGRFANGPTFAWTAGKGESLAMALSMLGLRTRAFASSEPEISVSEVASLGEIFDAFVDPPLSPDALRSIMSWEDARFVVEVPAGKHENLAERLPAARTCSVDVGCPRWGPICRLLGLAAPVDNYPVGTPAGTGMFQDGRPQRPSRPAEARVEDAKFMDDSPWALPRSASWRPRLVATTGAPNPGEVTRMQLQVRPSELVTLVETFPGNLAAFLPDGVVEAPGGKRLVLSRAQAGEVRPFRSGAFASSHTFRYGRFEAKLRAAAGPGLVTGFFLHRDTPRQEIDIELLGGDPYRMLVNVYFNPGDDGASMDFGYRGSPCRIDLGFDATADFHVYAIEWSQDRISWFVDGNLVHERRSWDPTPIPHLPMRLHANLWAPRSSEFAGRVNWSTLPVSAEFRKVAVLSNEES